MKKLILITFLFISKNIFAELAFNRIIFNFRFKNSASLYQDRLLKYGTVSPLKNSYLKCTGTIYYFELDLKKDSTNEEIKDILNEISCNFFHRLDFFYNENFLFSQRS